MVRRAMAEENKGETPPPTQVEMVSPPSEDAIVLSERGIAVKPINMVALSPEMPDVPDVSGPVDVAPSDAGSGGSSSAAPDATPSE
jgi:hypothetical protein